MSAFLQSTDYFFQPHNGNSVLPCRPGLGEYFAGACALHSQCMDCSYSALQTLMQAIIKCTFFIFSLWVQLFFFSKTMSIVVWVFSVSVSRKPRKGMSLMPWAHRMSWGQDRMTKRAALKCGEFEYCFVAQHISTKIIYNSKQL